jgi:hypothetical protein
MLILAWHAKAAKSQMQGQTQKPEGLRALAGGQANRLGQPTVRLLFTEVTPLAALAISPAWVLTASLGTVPVSVTAPPLVSTLICRALIWEP